MPCNIVTPLYTIEGHVVHCRRLSIYSFVGKVCLKEITAWEERAYAVVTNAAAFDVEFTRVAVEAKVPHLMAGHRIQWVS